MKNVITQNWAVFGGGIGIYNGSSPVITLNTISSNTSEGAGGGMIICNDCHPVITSNLFEGNLAKGGGGGIQIDDNCTAIIYTNVFRKNHSNYRGGAIESGRLAKMYRIDGVTPITETDGGNTFIDNTANAGLNIY